MPPSKLPYAGVFKLTHMTKHQKIMVLLTDWILNVPQGPPRSNRFGGSPWCYWEVVESLGGKA